MYRKLINLSHNLTCEKLAFGLEMKRLKTCVNNDSLTDLENRLLSAFEQHKLTHVNERRS
jgi:hypothetical protein